MTSVNLYIRPGIRYTDPKERKEKKAVDFTEICDSLAAQWPPWSERIRLLEFKESDEVRPVGNDGRSIYYNERLLRYVSVETCRYYIAQQLLQIQLAHFARRGDRDPRLWKKAGEAVANAMLREEGFELPMNAVLPPEDAPCSVESLYRVFLQDEKENGEQADDTDVELIPSPRPNPKDKRAGKESSAQAREIDDPGLAAIVKGLAEMLEPSNQLDFDWFPGTTIRDGMLRHEFRAYPVAHAEILLDTSASVDAELLRAFVRGVKGLLKQDAVVRVGCFDTRFYGFQEIRSEADIENLELRGAGGTDFSVAVNAFTGDAENQIIFTDGFAEVPEQRCDAIWVVYGSTTIHPPGGRVIVSRPTEEKEKHEIDFLIT